MDRLISVAARAVGCAENTLRDLERRKIIHPTRDRLGRRVFSEADVAAARAHITRYRQQILAAQTSDATP
jgi:DNA-binding transcriptional MerR regulator